MCIGAVYYAALLFYKSQFKQNTHTKKRSKSISVSSPKEMVSLIVVETMTFCC